MVLFEEGLSTFSHDLVVVIHKVHPHEIERVILASIEVKFSKGRIYYLIDASMSLGNNVVHLVNSISILRFQIISCWCLIVTHDFSE